MTTATTIQSTIKVTGRSASQITAVRALIPTTVAVEITATTVTFAGTRDEIVSVLIEGVRQGSRGEAQALHSVKRAVIKAADAAPAPVRKDSELEYVPGVGTTLPAKARKVKTETPAQADELAAARKRKGAALTPAEETVVKARTPRPNSDRRNEFTHEDGKAAVGFKGCASCGARKGKRCRKADGVTETNHVHAGRMKAWDAGQA